jgi:hypothetical protein
MATDPDAALPPALEDGLYKPQVGDKGLVLRLGDCRLCQHRTRRAAELVLVSALSELWTAFATHFNNPHPLQARTLPVEIPTPTAFRVIQQRLGWSINPGATEADANAWLPEGWSYVAPDLPFGDGRPEDAPRYGIETVAAHLLAGIVFKIHQWRRTKQQQADCCKDKVLRQLPGSRKNIWVPIPIFPGQLKKKVRTNPRRKAIPP